MAKVFERLGKSNYSNIFLFFTFFTALVLCICLVILKKELPDPLSLLFGALIGIPNFFSAKFLLRSLSFLSGLVAYPTYSVATILLVTLTGILIFKERLRKPQWIALIIILMALILLNI